MHAAYHAQQVASPSIAPVHLNRSTPNSQTMYGTVITVPRKPFEASPDGVGYCRKLDQLLVKQQVNNVIYVSDVERCCVVMMQVVGMLSISSSSR